MMKGQYIGKTMVFVNISHFDFKFGGMCYNGHSVGNYAIRIAN